MVVVARRRAVDRFVFGAEDEPVGNDREQAGSDGPVAAGDFLEEEAGAEREEHRHEEEEGGVVEALEVGLRVGADDVVGADGSEAAEQQQEPVLGGLDGEEER